VAKCASARTTKNEGRERKTSNPWTKGGEQMGKGENNQEEGIIEGSPSGEGLEEEIEEEKTHGKWSWKKPIKLQKKT